MMKKYKSLLYREVKISIKSYIERFMLMLLYIVMVLLIVFAEAMTSTDTPVEVTTGIALQFFLLLAILAALIICEDNEVFRSDIRTGWGRYSMVLPITALEKTITRYIIRIGTMLIGAVLCLLCTWIIDYKFGSSISGCIVSIYLIMLDVRLLVDAMVSTYTLLSGNEKNAKKIKFILIAILVLAVLCTFMLLPMEQFVSLLQEPSVNATMEFFHLPKTFTPIPILVLIPVMAFGFIVMWKNFERRER